MASRHLARSIAMQSLYEWDFFDKKANLEDIVEKNIKEFGPGLEDEEAFVWQLAIGVVENLSNLDEIIVKAAPEWPINQISIVDRNVLRLGLQELIYSNKNIVPPKVAINEAIELAKSFGGESSGKFINGVLGAVFKELGDTVEEMPKEQLAGGVVYREKDKKIQVALIKDVFGYWTLPKGHLEENEDLEGAAVREIKDETGLENLKIIKEIGKRSYIANEPEKGKIEKIVTDFLLESKDDKDPIPPKDSTGIKEAKWFFVEEISTLRKYKEVEIILDNIIKELQN